MKFLSSLKGFLVAAVILLMDAVILPLLDRAIAILDFLPDMIEAVWIKLKNWTEKHK